MRTSEFRRTRRTALTLLTLTATAVAVAACSTTAPEDGTNGAPAEVPKSVVFDFPYTTLPVYTALLTSAQEAADEAGYELLTTDDGGSLDTQVASLNTLITKGVGAIVSFPIETSALTTVQSAAQAAGTKWISYGTNMDGEDGSITLGNTESGERIAEALGDYLEANSIDEGTVLVLTNDLNELGRQRSDGMLQGLEEFAPQLTVIDAPALGSDEGTSVTQAKLISNPEIDYVLAVNDDTALGAANAFREAGKPTDTTFIGGNDGTAPVLQEVKDGTGYIKATVALNIAETGAAIVQTAVAAIEGGEETAFVAEPILVTKDSPEVDDLLAQFE